MDQRKVRKNENRVKILDHLNVNYPSKKTDHPYTFEKENGKETKTKQKVIKEMLSEGVCEEKENGLLISNKGCEELNEPQSSLFVEPPCSYGFMDIDDNSDVVCSSSTTSIDTILPPNRNRIKLPAKVEKKINSAGKDYRDRVLNILNEELTEEEYSKLKKFRSDNHILF